MTARDFSVRAAPRNAGGDSCPAQADIAALEVAPAHRENHCEFPLFERHGVSRIRSDPDSVPRLISGLTRRSRPA